MEERRTLQRRRALKGARVAFGDFRFTWDCVIRNLSPDGAMVRSDHAAEIPAEFYLWDPQEMTLRRAAVAWRTASDVGMRFLDAAIPVHGTDDPRIARFRFV